MMTTEAKLRNAIDRIRARLAGEWYDPTGDLESDMGKVLRELDGLDNSDEPEDSDENPFDPESPEGRAVDRGEMDPDGSIPLGRGSTTPTHVEPESIVCDVLTMQHSSGFPDHFTRIRVGRRELTLFMSKIRGRCEYHAAELNWLLNGADKPHILDFPDDEPQGLSEYLMSIGAGTPAPQAQLLASEWTDEDRAKAWRDAFDAMHQRAMRAEKCIRDNWLGGYWRSVDFSQANEVRIILADAPLATTEGSTDGK